MIVKPKYSELEKELAETKQKLKDAIETLEFLESVVDEQDLRLGG